jgi:hypothetical protein
MLDHVLNWKNLYKYIILYLAERAIFATKVVNLWITVSTRLHCKPL